MVELASKLAGGVVLLAVLLFLSSAPPAAAQADSTNESDPCADAEQLDATLKLCLVEIDDGQAVIVLSSSISQEVRLTDMASATGGGDVPFRDVSLQGGETTRIRFDVSTNDDGKAGVSISAERSIRSVILDDSEPFIGGPWTAADARNGALGAGAGTAFFAVVVVLRKLHGESDPESRLLG